MDHHNIVEDTIIGETTIDLENRFFSKKWRKLNEVPVETRKVFNPICSIPAGQVFFTTNYNILYSKMYINNLFELSSLKRDIL